MLLNSIRAVYKFHPDSYIDRATYMSKESITLALKYTMYNIKLGNNKGELQKVKFSHFCDVSLSVSIQA